MPGFIGSQALSVNTPQRILVIRGGAIGDFILTLPALRALRKTFPDAWIEIMGYPATAEIAHHRYYADAVSRVDAADIAPLFTPEGALPERRLARLRQFDLAVCFWKDEPGLLSVNLRRVGIPQVLCADPFPPAGRKVHAAAHMLEAISPLVGRGHDPAPRIFLNDADDSFGRQFLAPLRTQGPAPVLAAHPGSGGKHKCWPAPCFAALMEKAAAERQARWLLLCGPADANACAEVRQNLPRVRPVMVEGLSLLQLASVLSACDGYLGNDSGVTHLAAAVGAPTLAIFGPTDPAVWGPVGENVKTIASSPWPTVEQVWPSLAEIVRLGA